MRAPSGCIVKTGASMARQAAWAGGMVTPGAGEIERRLYEPRPRQPAEARVQGAEPAWEARDRAGPRPDRVMDELLAERDAQLDRRCPVPEGTSTKQSRLQASLPSQ